MKAQHDLFGEGCVPGDGPGGAALIRSAAPIAPKTWSFASIGRDGRVSVPENFPGKPRLRISFSGGRTSAFMTKYLLDNYSQHFDILVTFANTGQEHEATLEFVHQCDLHFGFNTVWLEAVVNPEHGKGTKHRVVTYETASRQGDPFADYIAKDGVPNMLFPHCTRELKQRPMDSYTRSIGWAPGTYVVAIGIREDEMRRVSKNATTDKIVYPLVDWLPTDKAEVLEFWRAQPFDLQLQEHQGNCTWCWKKSFAKHARLYRESPGIFDFPARMEDKFGHVKTDHGKGLNADGRRVFFRSNRSTRDLIALIEATPVDDERASRDDENGGCSESCELYPMDTRTADLFAEVV